jgi:hypothetical protein
MENGHHECKRKSGLFNSVTPLKTVTGQYLVHAKLSKAERAFIARDLHVGDTQLVRPTVVQSAWLAVVNPTYAHLAIRKSENERSLIEEGLMPLTPSTVKALPAPFPSAEQKLAEAVAEIGITGALTALAVIERTVTAV